MALVPPDVYVSNGNSISFARWATRNAQLRFPANSARNSTCTTSKMRMCNQMVSHAVRTTLDLHLHIHTYLRFRPSTVVLRVLNDPGVVQNDRCCASSVILNRCSKWRHRERLCFCTNDGFESLGQQPSGNRSCFCCDEQTLFVRVDLMVFDHRMSRLQLKFVHKYMIIYMHSNTDLLNRISEVDVLNFHLGVSNNLSLHVHKGSHFFQRSSLFV